MVRAGYGKPPAIKGLNRTHASTLISCGNPSESLYCTYVPQSDPAYDRGKASSLVS